MAEREYSFTELCIAESVNIVRKNQCCRRCFLFGVLIGASKYKGDDFSLRVKSAALSELLTKLIKEQFGRDAIVICKSSKTDTYELSRRAFTCLGLSRCIVILAQVSVLPWCLFVRIALELREHQRPETRLLFVYSC